MSDFSLRPEIHHTKVTNTMSVGPCVTLVDKVLQCSGTRRRYSYIGLSAVLTYLVYVGYHMCRVPIGIIENDEEFLSCSDDEEELCSSWIDQMNNITKSEARKKLGNMKTIWGFAYAFFMFLRYNVLTIEFL